MLKTEFLTRLHTFCLEVEESPNNDNQEIAYLFCRINNKGLWVKPETRELIISNKNWRNHNRIQKILDIYFSEGCRYATLEWLLVH